MTATTSSRVIDWIEGNLQYPSGPAAGDPVKLLPHEVEFIEGAFADGISEAALSMPRGNSKTGLCAMIAAAAVLPGGPLVAKGGQVCIVASSIEQGRVDFDDVLWHAQTIYDDWQRATSGNGPLKVSNTITTASIVNKEDRCELRVMGSDPGRAHGRRISLALLDEPAQWISTTGRDERMYAAIRTALGKIDGGKLIALGTRPKNPDHFFQRMLDGESEHVHSLCLAADSDTPDSKLADEDTWLPCNPIATVNPALYKQIVREASELDTQTARATFRALRLNLGGSDIDVGEPLVDTEVWRSMPRGDDGREGGYVLGLDMGSRTALSAVVAVYGAGAVDCRGVLGSRAEPIPVKDHRLITTSEPVPSADQVLAAAQFAWGDPILVVGDNYRSDDWKAACQSRGWRFLIQHSPEASDHAVRTFRTTLDDLILPESPLLDWCMAGARVVEASAGYKLARADQGGRDRRHRDDPIAALLPAVSMRLALLQQAEGQSRGAFFL